MTKTGDKAKGFDVYSYEVPEGYVNLIFSNEVGTQTSDLSFDAATPYFYENNWYASLAAVEAAGEPAKLTVYFVNDDDWTTVNAYVYADADPYPNYKAWPGEAMTSTGTQVNGKDVYSYTFPETYTIIIFNNGTDQTANLHYDASKTYYSKAQGQWYATPGDIPAVVVPAKFYITGTAVGGWASDAVKSTEDSYTITGLAADTEYQLKITIDGTWDTAKGYDELSEVAAGLSRGTGSDANNIKFTLATAGNVKVTYTESPAVFKLEGNFKTTPTAVDNIEAGEKAVKMVENGQLFIIKNGVRYNVLGAAVR